MVHYIINKNKDSKGYNEVHQTTCSHLPETKNQIQLGWFPNATSAVSYAKKNGYPNADGCYYCCTAAHRG